MKDAWEAACSCLDCQLIWGRRSVGREDKEQVRGTTQKKLRSSFRNLKALGLFHFPIALAVVPWAGSKQLGEDRTDLVTSNPKHRWCEKQRLRGLGVEAQKCGHFILLERQLGHCYEACGETGILKLPGWMKRMAMILQP